MSLLIPALCSNVLMDSKKLHTNILAHLSSDPRWMQSDNGFLQHDNQIYIPEAGNLQLRVLQYKHDHVLSGHFGQNKTQLIIQIGRASCRERV